MPGFAAPLMRLLSLKTDPPHLPEGVALVRHLKPAPPWLGLRYAYVLLRSIPTLFGFSFAMLVTAAKAPKPFFVALLVVVAVSVVGVAFALVTARIDFELRHYLVGDRSLRVSEGAWVRREVTLSYANVQNLEVLQGPLERAFGIKSLMVSTAGGEQVAGRPSSHQVVLAGIADADAVRALVLDMVKQQRDQGLGEAAAAHAQGGIDEKLLGEIRDAAQTLRDVARETPFGARS
jgi:membrane protein YdbS with pleckstrin-like domain